MVIILRELYISGLLLCMLYVFYIFFCFWLTELAIEGNYVQFFYISFFFFLSFFQSKLYQSLVV